jgi:cytochrome c553
MKRSDLKKYIREEIINTLSEQKPIPGFGIGKDDVELDKLRKGFEKAKSGADLPPEATVQDIAAYYSANPPKMVSEDEDEDYSKAEGAAKENLLAKLKELTKKKKEAKELVDKYADDVV